MTSISGDLARELAKLRSNVFADQSLVSQIEKQLNEGRITETDARKQILRLVRTLSIQPLVFTPQQLEDEWQALSAVLEASENRWKSLASSQFYIGLAALPVAVAGVIVSLFFGWQRLEGATAVATLLAGCLGAIAVHSFLVLRIHQQAGLAAERLSEKRVGILFLRLAVGREDPDQSTKLLEAGTSMFLGHHAPATLPLESGDFSVHRITRPSE